MTEMIRRCSFCGAEGYDKSDPDVRVENPEEYVNVLWDVESTDDCYYCDPCWDKQADRDAEFAEQTAELSPQEIHAMGLKPRKAEPVTADAETLQALRAKLHEAEEVARTREVPSFDEYYPSDYADPAVIQAEAQKVEEGSWWGISTRYRDENNWEYDPDVSADTETHPYLDDGTWRKTGSYVSWGVEDGVRFLKTHTVTVYDSGDADWDAEGGYWEGEGDWESYYRYTLSFDEYFLGWARYWIWVAEHGEEPLGNLFDPLQGQALVEKAIEEIHDSLDDVLPKKETRRKRQKGR